MKTICAFVLALATSLSAQSSLDPSHKSNWRLIDVSSENIVTGELASMAFDDNPETHWHTEWHTTRNNPAVAPPHHITFAFPEAIEVKSLRIRTRAHGEGGFPRKYQLEFGLNGTLWETVAIDEFMYRSRMSPHATVVLKLPRITKFVRLTIHSLYESDKAPDPGLVISEIDIESKTPLTPTTCIPVPQSREWNYNGYHWKTRHRNLINYARKNPINLVFIGDSITHRCGAPPYDKTPSTGKAIWEKYYGDRNALNLGYGWDRVENMIWRIRNGELDHTEPKLVVVMAGTNNLEVNTPKEIAQGVSKLCIEIYQRKPDSKILLLGVFPRSADAYPKELLELNERLAKLDKLYFVTFKDIGHVFLNEEGNLTREIMPDLLHPGKEGYRRWAEAIEEDIVRIMGE